MIFNGKMLRTACVTALLLLALVVASCQQEKSDELQAGQMVVDSVYSADSVMIYYQQQGTGEHYLVFVHGWGCDRIYWEKQLDEFSKAYRVVAIDLAGHGQSGLNREDWSIANFGADVAAVITKLDLKDVILIGHSMGGPTCIEAARLLPGRVKAIIGADVFQKLDRKLDPAQIDAWLAEFKVDFVASTEAFVRGMFAPEADTALVDLVARDMAQSDPDMGVEALRNVVLYDYASRLQGMDVPIRSINADMYETTVEVNKQIAPSYEVEIITGSGHFVQMEKPDEFNEMLHKVLYEFWPTPAAGE